MNDRLTQDAEADLRAIVRYTRRQWGAAQARDDVAKLEVGFSSLATGQGIFKQINALYPALRVMHCKHHDIFCLPRESAPALIIAILHERMDLITRSAARLC